jgi:hypothetical protein
MAWSYQTFRSCALAPRRDVLLHIAAFAHPGLLKLSLLATLDTYDKDATPCSLLPATSMRHLDIEPRWNPSISILHSDAAKLEQLLEALQHLETISTRVPTNLTTLSILSVRRALRRMSIVLTVQLGDFDLFGYADACLMLLSHISSPILTRMKLQLDGSDNHVLPACKTIQRKFARSIRELHMGFVPSTLNNPFSDLHPLLACHRLAELRLKGVGLWKLTDSDLQMMAASWTSLVSLKFLDSWLRWDLGGPPHLCDLSTLGLLQLATLPHLEILHLQISRFDIP